MSTDQPKALPTTSELLSAASSEQVILEQAGHHGLAQRIWREAREAAEQARRECWKNLAAQYGARNPHWGWASYFLLVAALSAAVAGVLSSGFRIDPADTIVAATLLSVIAAACTLVVSLGSRGLPQSQGFLRPLLVVAVGLGAAAAFQLSRAATPMTLIIAGSAVVGIGAFVAFLVIRGLNPEGTTQIDTAINVAIAQKQPDVDAIAARLQADVLAELTVDEQRSIVELRGTVPKMDAVASAETPPGGVIIRVLLATWIPDNMREDISNK